MSDSPKRPRKLWIRIGRGIALCAALILASLFLSIQIEQRVFRHRAEHLLADIQAIQLRQSTWIDAENLRTTWGKWGQSYGDCNAHSCHYQITISDSIQPLLMRYADSFLARPIFDTYFLLGGRTPTVWASFSVVDGIIWSKQLHALVAVPSNLRHVGIADGSYMIAAKVVSRGKLGSEMNIDSRQFIDHPDYGFSGPGGCTDCIAGWVHFTPYTSPEVVHRLMSLDLSCITRLLPCREIADLMPAWSESRSNGDFSPGLICPIASYALGREAGTVMSADVVSQTFQIDPDTKTQVPAVTIKVSEIVKGSQYWQAGTIHTLASDANLSTIMPSVGGHYMLFFDDDNFTAPGPSVLEPCHVLLDTEGNRREVLRGVDQDKAFLPQGYEPFM